MHTDLMANKMIEDPFYRTNEKDLQWIGLTDWEYKISFKVDDNLLQNQHIESIFEGGYLCGCLFKLQKNIYC